MILCSNMRHEEAVMRQMEFERNRQKELLAKSNGGPSTYYDFPKGNEWVTLNDLMEWKAINHWGHLSLHLKDVMKACFRIGTKPGVDQSYDARKIVYSGLRMLVMMKGREEVASFLHQLTQDPQFKEHK